MSTQVIAKSSPSTAYTGPGQPCIEYIRMSHHWHLPMTLWGGTEAMRRAGKRYLPQEEGESDKAYKARLQRTFLYNAFKSTIQRLAGQAFLKDVVVENVPKELEYLEHHFDAEGRSITEVAYDMMVHQLRFGKAHGIVDYPSYTHNLTVADERALQIRPYFTIIDPVDLIGWRAKQVGGASILEQIRIQELIVEPYDDYTDIEVYRVRVFYPDHVEIYRFSDDGDAIRDGEDIPFTLGEIPLVTAYGEKTGFLTSKCPLEDLAWLNLRHWQSSSDQANILHVARVPIFFARGFEEGELASTTFGPHRGICTSKENAEIKYVEHSGAAIGAGEDDLNRIEEQMYRAGADLLDTRSVSRQTSYSRQTDRTESMSVIQTMIDNLERALENAYEYAGKWIGVDASGVRVRIADEFSINDDPNPIDSLIKLGLSEQDLIAELKRRGIISDGVNNLNIEEIDNNLGETL